MGSFPAFIRRVHRFCEETSTIAYPSTIGTYPASSWCSSSQTWT